MKNFYRENQNLPLCGLNYKLCPMFIGSYCGGCGNGNQACSIARCGMSKGVEYCFACKNYPCEKYDGFDETDSFITHAHRKNDFEQAQTKGLKQYNSIQQYKEKFLKKLLAEYNDGRKKSFFCLAVNLLDAEELKSIEEIISSESDLNAMLPKEKSKFVSELFLAAAEKKGICLKLRRKDRRD